MALVDRGLHSACRVEKNHSAGLTRPVGSKVEERRIVKVVAAIVVIIAIIAIIAIVTTTGVGGG